MADELLRLARESNEHCDHRHRGDYVLDNQTADILLCSRTGYRFVKRQSQSNLSLWVSHDLRPAVASLTLNARLERQGRCRVGQRRGRRLASFG
jgi:Bacterial transglutaminase-like cysteine proteinase BTLCP